MTKRWPKIVAVIAALALVAFGIWYWLRPVPRAVGVPCVMGSGADDEGDTYVGCNGGLCIHETDDTHYCTIECKTDDECPTGYVCEPTRSGRRHACMEEGVDVTPADAAAPDGAVAHVFRRKR